MTYELVSKGIKEPICGWQWVYAHLHDLDGWKPTIEFTTEHGRYTIGINPNRVGVIKEVSKILNTHYKYIK